MVRVLTLEITNELANVCKWMMGQIGYACEDYLYEVAKESYDESILMEDYAGEPAYPTYEDKLQHVMEIVWGEAENYVDFVKERSK